MAVPKRKVSKSRRNKRAAQWKLARPNLQPCPRCLELKMPHRVCPNCGYYKDREVISEQE